MKTLHLTDSSIICKTRDILFSNLDGEILGIDSQAGYFYSMNETANHVWETLATPVSFADLISITCAKFDVDEATCRKDLQALLVEFHTAELIKVDNG